MHFPKLPIPLPVEAAAVVVAAGEAVEEAWVVEGVTEAAALDVAVEAGAAIEDVFPWSSTGGTTEKSCLMVSSQFVVCTDFNVQW